MSLRPMKFSIKFCKTKSDELRTLKRSGSVVSSVILEGSLVRDSTEALCCVIEQDTLSSA